MKEVCLVLSVTRKINQVSGENEQLIWVDGSEKGERRDLSESHKEMRESVIENCLVRKDLEKQRDGEREGVFHLYQERERKTVSHVYGHGVCSQI